MTGFTLKYDVFPSMLTATVLDEATVTLLKAVDIERDDFSGMVKVLVTGVRFSPVTFTSIVTSSSVGLLMRTVMGARSFLSAFELFETEMRIMSAVSILIGRPQNQVGRH